MYSNKAKEDFLLLVRLGIGLRTCVFPDEINWKGIEDLAVDQGLSAIVLDGIEGLPEDKRPSKALRLNWIGTVLHEYEYRYNAYSKCNFRVGRILQ